MRRDRNPLVELYAFAVVALGLILYGYPVGVTNVMLGAPSQFQRDAGVEGDVETLGMLVSANSVGALLGCALALAPVRGTAAADWFGRARFMRAGAALYFCASVGMCVTPVTLARDALGRYGPALWFGFWRLVYGTGQTLSYSGAAVYLAELTSQRTRGYYLPMIAVMTMSGDLLGNFVGLSLEPAKGGWRVLAALPAPVAAAFWYYAGQLPETPRWLVLKATNDANLARKTTTVVVGNEAPSSSSRFIDDDDDWTVDDLRLDDARASVAVLRSETFGSTSFSLADACLRRKQRAAAATLLVPPDPTRQTPEKLDEIEREIRDIVDVIKTTSRADARRRDSCVAAIDAPASRRAMTVAFGLAIMSMLSGVPAMSYFAKHIFEMTGHNPTAASGMTTALAFVKLVVTVFVAASLETFGRRRMLLTGISMQCVATSLLAYLFDGVTWIEDPRHAVSFQLLNGSVAQVADGCIFINAVGFHLSFWALAWTVANELSPLRARATITALNSMFSWTLSTVTVRFCPVVMKRPGISATFGFCATCLFAAVGFVYLYVPETKGRTLEELEMVMTRATSLRDVVRRLNPNSTDGVDDAERRPLRGTPSTTDIV